MENAGPGETIPGRMVSGRAPQIFDDARMTGPTGAVPSIYGRRHDYLFAIASTGFTNNFCPHTFPHGDPFGTLLNGSSAPALLQLKGITL